MPSMALDPTATRGQHKAHGPSVSPGVQTSDTSSASSEQPPAQQPQQRRDSSPDQSDRPDGGLPSPRNLRSQSLAHHGSGSGGGSGVGGVVKSIPKITTSGSSSAIKRKPLSASASPLVTSRYSQPQALALAVTFVSAAPSSPSPPMVPAVASVPSMPSAPSLQDQHQDQHPHEGQQQQQQQQQQRQSGSCGGGGSGTNSHGQTFTLDILDELPMPDQRFSRSCSVDSPTIYQFPDGEVPALMPLAPQKESHPVPQPRESWQSRHSSLSSLSSYSSESAENRDADAGQSLRSEVSRNTPRTNPAASQTQPTAGPEQTLSLASRDVTPPTLRRLPSHRRLPSIQTSQTVSTALPCPPPLPEVAAELPPASHTPHPPDHLEGDQIVTTALYSKPDDSLSSINTHEGEIMSLFARKPTPPHLTLAPVNRSSTNNSNINNKASTSISTTLILPTVVDIDARAQAAVAALAATFTLPATTYSASASATTAPAATNTAATATKKTTTTTTTTTTTSATATVITSSTKAADATDNLNTSKPLPNPPTSASRLGTFFGWGSSSSVSPSSTEFSDRGYSPLPSPFSPKPVTVFTNDTPVSATAPGPILAKTITNTKTHSNTAQGQAQALGYCEDYLQTPPAATTPAPEANQIEDMEDELKAISAELAASIRREMDLEDLVDRLQSERENPQAPGKRTSDYFSDSGYSSAKLSEYDASREEIAQVQRRAEQEKAQVRLELGQKLQEERGKRRELDGQIKELSARASSLVGRAQQAGSAADGARVRELESTCEDLRRRLSEERQVKDNFEDLLSALKGELESAANERDNLRDEVVPQLRARVEGLEAQAAEHSKLTYESTKMQQELQTLKVENATLKVSSSSKPRPQQPQQQQQTPATRAGRSSSVASSVSGPSSFKLQQAPLGRSNTVRGQPQTQPQSHPHQIESREALSDRLKDVESQRDALHSALKNLLERQEFQNRENEKKIRVLEQERERLLAASPKKAGYERDVANLREEVTVLRQRAEEALEQKWQVEKGLSGLKMDLDRAEEEIAALKSLLREKDILIPAALERPSSSGSSASVGGGNPAPVSSASLEKAYKDLQLAYAQALERIKKLELGPGGADDKTASLDADPHSSSRERTYLETERDLAEQLSASARRVEELAAQVQSQLAANAALRVRLSDAVSRGEADRRSSKERIASMQTRLNGLERELVAAQTSAEERVARHEDELRSMREAHGAQLQRLRDGSGGMRSPRPFAASSASPAARSPMSPMFAATGTRSPRLLLRPGSSHSQAGGGSRLSPNPPSPSPRRASTMPSPGGEESPSSAAQVEKLKARVGELERALSAAEVEMHEVVGRMSSAQIEVLQLQEEREGAVRETRKLQRLLEAERVKAFEGRFRTIGSGGMAA